MICVCVWNCVTMVYKSALHGVLRYGLGLASPLMTDEIWSLYTHHMVSVEEINIQLNFILFLNV
jgi:hypothetical protein